ncbi:MAG TPA: DNA topoisomerase III [Opitutaceae bacterium]|nr:DNA topoisomerase III [Opitutaceae bacterium]
MKSLIIAEKPSVAADLARALGKVPKKGDHFENDRYVISSAVGHLVELLMPEDIDKKAYGFWRLEMLPIIPEKFGLKPIEQSKERFDHLKKLLARKDIDEVINACDAGREGELIFTYIYQLTKSKLPVKRAWMQTMTAEGIRTAFANLRDGSQMAGLAAAARSRSESDWLIGINGTRALTKRMFGSRAGNVASVGRVQTPTLAIVYARELEIRNFKPRPYWRITANFGVSQGEYEGVYQRPNFKKNEEDEHDRADRVWDEAVAKAVHAACQGQPPARVTDEKKASTQASPRLYDLTTLQREANNRFGISARRTSQIAQALYERHKVITYPRTDSRALPEDYIPTVQQTLGNLAGDLAPHAQKVLAEGWVRPNKRIFNNEQISDHFAIIPTVEAKANLEEFEAKIFDMIARRFVAVFYPSAEFDITTRTSVVAEHAFKSEGKVLTFPGWLAVYGKTTVEDSSPDSKSLPALAAADGNPAQAKTLAADLHAEATKPPPRYTEATLLSAMEGAGKLVDDEELAEAMKERGLGTPATRADTIEGLANARYLERAQRELIPTPKAEQLLQFLAAVKAEEITSPAMTGEWEYKLRQIEQNKFTREKFMAEIVAQTKGIVKRVKGFEEDDSVARVTDIISPTDGKPLRETLRGYKSQDGALMVYKVVGNRKMEESEIKEILGKGQIGPLDGFRSKAGKPFSAVLRYNPEEKKVEFVFDGQRDASGAMKIDFTGLQPTGPAPAKFGEGAQIYETPQSYVVRLVANGEDKVLVRCSKRILSRDIPKEQFLKMLETGKTDLLDKFWSQRTRRPFSAFLVLKPDNTTGFEFAPRPPKDPNAPKGRGKRKAAPKAAEGAAAPAADGAAGQT